MRSFALAVLLLIALGACDDDAPDPESVPFSGLDPAVQRKRPRAVPKPAAEPSTSAASSAKVPPSARGGGALSACCAALAATGRGSSDHGHRNNAMAASRVCFNKLSAVKRGELTTASALSQVRSSILGTAPRACR